MNRVIHLPAAFAALAVATCWPAGAAAQIAVNNPVVINTAAFGATQPSGIAYHPYRDTWFITDTGRAMVYEVTSSGSLVSSFSTTAFESSPKGIGYDWVSGGLMVASGEGFVDLVSAVGDILPPSPFLAVNPPSGDIDGVAVAPDTGTVFVGDDADTTIYEFSRAGMQRGAFSTAAILPGFVEPEGVGFFGNDLLVADDKEGTNSIYLLSRTGSLIQVVLNGGAYGLSDLEGVAAKGLTHIAAVSSDDARMLIFETGQEPVPFMPHGGLAVLAVLLALSAGCCLARRDQKSTPIP